MADGTNKFPKITEEGLAALRRKTAEAGAGCARLCLESLLLLGRRRGKSRNARNAHRACKREGRPSAFISVHIVSTFIDGRDTRERGLRIH